MKQQPVPFDHKRDLTGRWSALDTAPEITRDAALDVYARVLLERYGVMFRRLLTRETNAPSWRELTRVYRRLEARGEIRGGRFVTGVSGEQFALPEAVERLREVRRSAPSGRLVTISAADPLNLTGILAGDDRVRAVTSTRIVYRDGVALAALEGDYLRPLGQVEPTLVADVASAAAGRRMPAVSSGFVGRSCTVSELACSPSPEPRAPSPELRPMRPRTPRIGLCLLLAGRGIVEATGRDVTSARRSSRLEPGLSFSHLFQKKRRE